MKKSCLFLGCFISVFMIRFVFDISYNLQSNSDDTKLKLGPEIVIPIPSDVIYNEIPELDTDPGEVIISILPNIVCNKIPEPERVPGFIGPLEQPAVKFGIPEVDDILNKYGLIYIDPMEMDNMYQLEFSEDTNVKPIIEELNRISCVRYTVEDLEVFKATQICLNPNDPLFVEQHHHALIHSLDMWKKYNPNEGSEVLVCIVDTGVDYNHEDLNANMLIYNNNYGYDAFTRRNDPKNRLPSESHATHCSGIVSSVFNNNTGGTGMGNKIKIRSYRGLNEHGSGTLESLCDAMKVATDQANKINDAREKPSEIAAVFNMSWGTHPTMPEERLRPLKEVVNYCRNHKIFMVAAAGNEDYPSAGYPAKWVLAVAATGYYDGVEQRAYFSSYGEGVDLCAPGDGMSREFGDGIMSTLPNNKYGRMRGTSMASPVVAGNAAAIISRFPNITQAQLEDVLIKSGDEIECDVHIGLRMNALKAMDMAANR